MSFKLKIVFILIVSLFYKEISVAQTKTIWLVRHAEKDLSDPQDINPSLSAEGRKRANDLLVYLRKNKPAVIYSTEYKRSRQTVAGFGREIKLYQPKALKNLAGQVLQSSAHRSVLIVGHSNTVLETIEALGGKPPVKALTDEDYDYIFKLTIKGGVVRTETYQYGEPHRNKNAEKMMMQ